MCPRGNWMSDLGLSNVSLGGVPMLDTGFVVNNVSTMIPNDVQMLIDPIPASTIDRITREEAGRHAIRQGVFHIIWIRSATIMSFDLVSSSVRDKNLRQKLALHGNARYPKRYLKNALSKKHVIVGSVMIECNITNMLFVFISLPQQRRVFLSLYPLFLMTGE